MSQLLDHETRPLEQGETGTTTTSDRTASDLTTNDRTTSGLTTSDLTTSGPTTGASATRFVGQALLRLVVLVVAVLLALVFVAAWRPDLIDQALTALGY